MEPGLRHPITGVRFESPVPPGAGWPDDPASPTTPVARTAVEVIEQAEVADLAAVDAGVSVCQACERLVEWRESVALHKRASFSAEPYWGRPIAGWGSEAPRVLIIGLAPAAHGGNRTGRIFTGDRSGDWLFASLHRVGLAAQPASVAAGDGQRLLGARMLAAVRCAPPDNKPTTLERDTCAPWMDRELALVLDHVHAIVCLGSFAWDATLRALKRAGHPVASPKPKFGHGAETSVGPITVLGCYHPSQQNTFTGRLTEPMLDAVLGRAAELGRATP